jgi:hypothetical protein
MVTMAQLNKTNGLTQPVKNTMDRIGIDYASLEKNPLPVPVTNRFTGETCVTSVLVAECVRKIYAISNAYENGDQTVNVSDFDRLRYFVLAADQTVYNTCVD